MCARVLLLVLMNGLFMAAWTGDQAAGEAALARQQRARDVLVASQKSSVPAPESDSGESDGTFLIPLVSDSVACAFEEASTRTDHTANAAVVSSAADRQFLHSQSLADALRAAVSAFHQSLQQSAAEQQPSATVIAESPEFRSLLRTQ